jgi:hypothetical protein
MSKHSDVLYRVYGEGRDPGGNSVVVYQVPPGKQMFCQECGKELGQGELFSRSGKKGDSGEQFSFCRICRPFSEAVQE